MFVLKLYGIQNRFKYIKWISRMKKKYIFYVDGKPGVTSVEKVWRAVESLSEARGNLAEVKVNYLEAKARHPGICVQHLIHENR